MSAGPATQTNASATPSTPDPSSLARVSLLIRSHALPPLTYRIPNRLRDRVRVGSAVVVPLSGYGRLGIVVGFERPSDRDGVRDLRPIRSVSPDLNLPARHVSLCDSISSLWAIPLQVVLRAALPPGTSASAYRILRPAPEWEWTRGAIVPRAELRRALGPAGLKSAEQEMRVLIAPARQPRRSVEWSVLLDHSENAVPGRAYRQRAIVDALTRHGGARPSATLVEETGADRAALRRLVERGALRLEGRPEAAPVSYTTGSGSGLGPYEEGAVRALDGGGAWIWRVPSAEWIWAVAAIARRAAARGSSTLVIAPETEAVERLFAGLRQLLPAGLTIAPYHARLGRSRDLLYEAVGNGEIDVLVGTRSSALLPFGNLGAICVVDEPNESHRADPGNHEGVPVHSRDTALERARTEDVSAVFLAPTPSLRLFGAVSEAARLPSLDPPRWPSVRLVDVGDSGALLSSALLDGCRETLREGGRVGVMANRLGLATLVACRHCGRVLSCPACDLPLSLRDGQRGMVLDCANCGRTEEKPRECPSCGSDRFGASGLAVGRIRALLAEALGTEVGLLTAGETDLPGARIVAGTARPMLKQSWDLIAIPDADALLFGSGSVERGFGLLYAAAEASRERLVAQTRSPEHLALRAALAGDYEGFAASELRRRRELGYPPFGHLARITLFEREDELRGAVESWLRPALEPGVELTGPAPVPAGSAGTGTAWRFLLRSRRQGPVAAAAAGAARKAAGRRGGPWLRVEVDPEEV